MPSTRRTLRLSSSATSSAHQQQQPSQQRPAAEPRLAQLDEEQEHERLTSHHHRHLVLEKLDNLRLLVKEIQDDDWCFDPKERIPNHVTKSLAWKPATTTGAETKSLR